MTTAEPRSRTGPEAGRSRLSGGLGAGAIVFVVVAAAAPLAVVGGIVPLGALLGNGAGMPSTFLAGGAILLFFAVGLSTMSRYVAKPGAFFTYVGYGLGRPAGVAAAWMALLTYTASQVAVFAYLGLTLGNWVDGHGGPGLPWWLWSLAMVGLVGTLGYRYVEAGRSPGGHGAADHPRASGLREPFGCRVPPGGRRHRGAWAVRTHHVGGLLRPSHHATSRLRGRGRLS